MAVEVKEVEWQQLAERLELELVEQVKE